MSVYSFLELMQTTCNMLMIIFWLLCKWKVKKFVIQSSRIPEKISEYSCFRNISLNLFCTENSKLLLVFKISLLVTTIVFFRMACFTIRGYLWSSNSSWDAFANLWILKSSAAPHFIEEVVLYLPVRCSAQRELGIWILGAQEPDLLPLFASSLPGKFNLP